jgi:ADP-ribose pyrophosphatase YjhB (NUDIX family)
MTGDGVKNAGAGGQRRRRRRRSPNPGTAQLKPGQVTNTVAVPTPAAPSKRGQKRPLADPRIAVGCIVLRGDEILLVRERGRWSLPKGGLESGELVQDGARRETFEETGLVVELRDLAFIVEFKAQTWGHHLQFFYTGREAGGKLEPRDPDRDVQEARFVPIRQLREFIRFRPRLVALETWLRERRPRHFVFNLDKEPAMLRKRRRVGEPGVPASDTELTDEPDL